MKRLGFATIAAFALVAPAWASWGDHLGSVHFHSGKPDFGTAPRRGQVWSDEEDDRPSELSNGLGFINHFELSVQHDNEREANRLREREAISKQAAGDLGTLRRLWQGFAARFGTSGTVRDRLEVLAHPRPPSDSTALRRYLAALDKLEGPSTGWNEARAEFATLHADTTLPRWLREHAAYQRAAALAQWLNYKEAIPLWKAQILQFPEGEKREAALLMIARACLLHKGIPEGVRTGRAAAEQLLRAFPKTRFRVAARGLVARADLEDRHYETAATAYCTLNDGDSIVDVRRRAGKTPQEPRLRTLQLVAYLHALNNATDHRAYYRAVQGVSRSLALFKPATGKVFLERLVGDPSLAAPYFYFRLYHCDNKPADFERLVRLADRIAVKEALPPVVRVRLAELYYQNDAFGRAASWASTATQNPDAGIRGRALYVRAGSRYRQSRFDSTRTDLERILAQCPTSNVRHAARELLAIVAERQGDFPTALDQFFTLDYRDDYAYLIDARIPIPTLESYWQTHSAHRDLLAYSLALRHLRLEHWDEAKRWLERVPEKSYALFVGRTTRDSGWEDSFSEQGANPKKVLASLSHLWRAAQKARGAEAKAAANYAYARAYYTQGLLQLYNAPLWQGERMWSFIMNWNKDIATPADDRAVQRYMYQHEVYAHTRQLCLGIVRRYPNSSTAPTALYRAACAAERLNNLNEWWRADENGWWEYADDGQTKKSRRQRPLKDHNQEASHLMARLARDYPNHPLAKPARKYAAVFVGKGDFE